ncbi:uncharacterized protein METZ01_LOCUS419411, partial [marine metagenome]
DQSYAILLGSDNTTTDMRFRYVDPPDVSLTNQDLTDKGTFYVSKISNTTDENGQKATFTVRLSSAPSDNGTTSTDNVTITLSVSDTSEGEIFEIGNKQAGDNLSALVFTDSNWNSERTVTVRGVFDNVSDGDQKYTVVLKDNVSSDARFRYVDPADVEVTNVDLTGKGGFYVSAVSGATDENGQTATFSVRLTSQPSDNGTQGQSTDNVTITLSSSDTSEGVLLSASALTFTSSNWNAAQTVTVLGVHDNILDGDQSYAILLGSDNTTTDMR